MIKHTAPNGRRTPEQFRKDFIAAFIREAHRDAVGLLHPTKKCVVVVRADNEKQAIACLKYHYYSTGKQFRIVRSLWNQEKILTYN